MMLSKWRLKESRLLSEGRRGLPMEIGDLRPPCDSDAVNELKRRTKRFNPDGGFVLKPNRKRVGTERITAASLQRDFLAKVSPEPQGVIRGLAPTSELRAAWRTAPVWP